MNKEDEWTKTGWIKCLRCGIYFHPFHSYHTDSKHCVNCTFFIENMEKKKMNKIEAAKNVTEKGEIAAVEIAENTLNDINKLHNEIEQATNILIPLLREYLNSIRSIRMSLDSEVQNILRTSQSLGEITKNNKEIKEFCINIGLVAHVVTDHKDIIMKLASILVKE